MTDARDELVRSLAGLALFADLRDPDLWAIADPEKERLFGEGERVLRRGLSGGGFFVILDGEAAVEIPDGEPRRLRRGDFFGEVSTLLECKPTADVVARTAAAHPRDSRAAARGVPPAVPAGHATGCCRPWPAGSATCSSSG